ncbi:MAG: hypothetical protein RR500_09405, partial [Bacilli bacterium]
WLSSARYKTGQGIVVLKFDSCLKPYMLGVVTAKSVFYTLRHIFPKHRYIKTILQHIGAFIPFSFS